MTDEIVEILERFRLDRRHARAHGDPALWQAAPARDRARASPAGRACCCSTSRPPACRKTSATSILATIARIAGGRDGAADRARHGPRVLVRRPHFGAGQWRAVRRGRAGGGRARSARAERSISARSSMPDLLEIEALVRRLRRGGGAVAASRCRSPRADALALLGRNGMGKTTLINSIIGVTRYLAGTHRASTGATSPRCAPDQRAHAGVGWVPQERNIFTSLTVRGEPHRRGAARAAGPLTRSTPCSRGSTSAAQILAISCPAASSRCWRSAARWCSTRASSARRAARRPGADHRRGVAGGAAAHHPRRRHVGDHGRAEGAQRSWASPTTPSFSSAAASSSPATAPRSPTTRRAGDASRRRRAEKGRSVASAAALMRIGRCI